MLKKVLSLVSPIVPSKVAVSIDPGDILPIEGKTLDSEVNHILFKPQFVLCLEPDITGVIWICDHKISTTKGHFYRVKYGSSFGTHLAKVSKELPPGAETLRIKDRRNYIKRLMNPIGTSKGPGQTVVDALRVMVCFSHNSLTSPISGSLKEIATADKLCLHSWTGIPKSLRRVFMAGTLDPAVVDGVVNANFKTVAEQIAFASNHAMQLQLRAQEDALQDQRDSRLLSKSILGSLTKRIVESDITEAVANRNNATADLPQRIVDSGAAVSSDGLVNSAMVAFAQILAKMAQSTPPQTAQSGGSTAGA